jgi:type IV pilus assembly protein PilA
LTTKCSKGFTLVELMVVIVIVGILASIALMQILNFREGSYNATLKSDLRSVYTASKQFYIDHPNDAVTETKLEEYGYVPSENVIIKVEDGSEAGLLITASHPGTPNDYQVDHAGRISKQ